jgi:hypothetical protein
MWNLSVMIASTFVMEAERVVEAASAGAIVILAR